MQDKASLQKLATDYLRFLLSRHIEDIKSHLSLDFVKRRDAVKQLKLIRQLPLLRYGINPEIQLWDDYHVTCEDHEKWLTPFQFHVITKNIHNPLECDVITMTIHKLVFEDGVWKIASIITEEELPILANFIKKIDKHTTTEPGYELFLE